MDAIKFISKHHECSSNCFIHQQEKTSIYLGHFSFIKINILVVGYDSYTDFIQSMGLVLSMKNNFIHGDRLLGVMFYPLTHILVC